MSFIKSLSWGLEIKNDIDGICKQFIYLDTEFKYISGDIIVPEGLEKVEWIPTNQLKFRYCSTISEVV